MSTAYSQYGKYLKHLLEVECAEKELDFNKIFISYLNVQKADDDTNDLEEVEKKRLAEESKKKEEPLKEELEEKQPKDAERQKQIEREFAEQQKREEEARQQKEQLKPVISKRGDLEFEDGYYVGETKDGLMHGHGTRYWDYDDKKWEGDWQNDEANGHVVVTFGDIVVYDGKMEHGLPNGQGVYTDINNGQRYEGSFVDFKREGEGVLYTENGDKIYDGEWKNNKCHGYGQYFLRGQCRYEGNWENGKRNGDGIAYDQNGQEEYNGTWKDDTRLNDIDLIKLASKE